MIIYLNKSILFTKDPDERFSIQYNKPKGTLKDIYRRYKIMNYSMGELCEFYEFKTNTKITKNSMKRWMWRTEVYIIAQPAMESGVVVSSFFKKHEWKVVKELLKNLKYSVKGKTKTII